MAEVFRTSRAGTDLVEIWLYVAEYSIEAADRLLAAIDEKCRLLAASPEIGEARDDLGSGVRCFTHGNYVIFYKVIVGGIQLIRMSSGAGTSTPFSALIREAVSSGLGQPARNAVPYNFDITR